MHLGQLKTLDHAIATASPRAVAHAEAAYDALLSGFMTWTPSTFRQIVQACNVARHMLDHAQEMDGGSLDVLQQALREVVRLVRARDLRAARAMELLPHVGAFAGLDVEHEAYEVAVLAAIGRAAPMAYRWAL